MNACSERAQAVIDRIEQRGYRVYFMSMDNMVVCTAHHPTLSRAATGTDDHGDDYAAVHTVADKLDIDMPGSPTT